MVGSKRSIGAAFSWADEVEREEAEAVEAGVARQKLNPFGCARPRELVLQEKGIDWRKLENHQEQRQISPSRYGPHKVLKLSNVKACEVAPVLLTQQGQLPLVFDPPLKYPPKIIIGRISETQRFNQISLPRKHRPGKENRFHEPEIQTRGKLETKNTVQRSSFVGRN